MESVRIPPVSVMIDETVMKHMELRHDNDLRMEFKPEPDQAERRLHAPTEWRTFHNKMHEMHGDEYNHTHNEE